MESASKDLTENTDNDASQVVSHCLATSVILRKILQHFSNTELLTCSLVNKQWNYEARCLIRDRGSSIANLVDSYLLPPRRDLAAFASDLLQMNVVPFCGMKISLDWIPPSPYLVHPFQLSSSTEASIIPDVIFERLPFKYFHIVIEAPFGGCSDPTLLFIQKVLQGLGGDLEELAVSLRPEHDNFFQRLFRQYTFPNLKTFSFDARDDEDYTKFIKMLLANAPNLQELRVDLSYLKKNVLEGSSALLVPSKDFDPFLQQFSESFVRMLKLRSLSAVEGTPDFSVERFNRIMPMWLETSRTSLKSLKIHSVFAVPIMGYGISLDNVTELILYMDSSRALDFLRVCDLLKVFDLLVTCNFTRIFPKLHDVSIECRPNGLEVDHLKQFLSQGKNAMLEKPMRDRAANIKHLSLSQCLNSYTARLLPNVFPDIQRLSVRLDEQLDVSCGLIWKHWVGLKEIKVQKTSWIRDVPRIANLDSVFCGIFPEEVDELRGKDDEYLKCVNIVPIMPSITCLKNLKKFRFVFDWSDWSGTMTNGSTFARGDFRDPTFVFSKVSGLVAFARCPTLSVSLETNWAPIEKALRHMKAYASVVLTR